MEHRTENDMIRDIAPKDKEIFLSMVKSFYSSAAVTHDVESQNFTTTFDAVMNKSPYIRALLIEENDRPVGYSLLSFTYSNEVGGLVVLIEELYLREEYRGTGLGSKVFDFLEQEYPSAKRFSLEVRKDNTRAIDLYERLGFTVSDYVHMEKYT